MPFWKSSKPESLAARGDHAALLKALQPARGDFLEDRGGNVVDAGWERRAAAARHLADSADPTVTEGLLGALDDVSPAVRTSALTSLAGSDEAIDDALVTGVLSWPEQQARDEAEAPLLERAERDPAAAARMATAYVEVEVGAVLSDAWVDRVMSCVPGPERQSVTADAAAFAVADLGIAPRCLQALRADPRESVAALRGHVEADRDRLAAIRVLGDLRDQAATEPLVRLLEDPDPEVRRAAASSLALVRDPHAIEALLRATADHSYDVRDAALRALDEFGTAAIVWGLAAASRGALDDVAEVAERWTASESVRAAEPVAEAPPTVEPSPVNGDPAPPDPVTRTVQRRRRGGLFG